MRIICNEKNEHGDVSMIQFFFLDNLSSILLFIALICTSLTKEPAHYIMVFPGEFL